MRKDSQRRADSTTAEEVVLPSKVSLLKEVAWLRHETPSNRSSFTQDPQLEDLNFTNKFDLVPPSVSNVFRFPPAFATSHPSPSWDAAVPGTRQGGPSEVWGSLLTWMILAGEHGRCTSVNADRGVHVFPYSNLCRVGPGSV